ncbi:unnamed protein product, partial [Cyprideis torosa]
MGGGSGDKKASENVQVVVRVRPLNAKEVQSQCRNQVDVNSSFRTVSLRAPNAAATDPPKTFTFDDVFGPNDSQIDIYTRAARGIVENVLEGYNGTIFAYGQTGTGKTYTMEGSREVPELRGIIPNSFAHIFGHIAKQDDTKNFLVRVSYLEIYNEEVRDLLVKGSKTRLEVRERSDIGVYVKDLSAYVVNNADDMDRIMTIGNKNRVVGATNMNQVSSRSHAIFCVTVECSELGLDGDQHIRVGKLNLVDLAGSERQSKTGATGERFKEATKINLSLSTLGNVISSLVDGKSTHVPYRDSKLTRLLMDSLGGNSKTLMCANVGPADYNYEETLSTLRFADRAKRIQNHAVINEDPKDALLREFQKEIEALRKKLEEGEEGSEEEATEEEEEAEEEDGEKVRRKGKPKRKGVAALQELMARVESERRVLEERKDMEDQERQKAMTALRKHEQEVQVAQQEQAALSAQLDMLKKKVIVGGENLLEKAELQEKLLEESAHELASQKEKQRELSQALEQKEAERATIEEKYSSLQEETAAKSKKIKKVHTELMGLRGELQDMRMEQSRAMEGLLDNVRQLSRELQLQKMIMDQFIPEEYQALIEECVTWNEGIGEWQLRGVAYTGNNMKKIGEETKRDKRESESPLPDVYLSYGPEGLSSRRAPSSSRPRTALGGRPKSSKSDASCLPYHPRSLHHALGGPHCLLTLAPGGTTSLAPGGTLSLAPGGTLSLAPGGTLSLAPGGTTSLPLDTGLRRDAVTGSRRNVSLAVTAS